MNHVFLRRHLPQPIDKDVLAGMAADAAGSFRTHRVVWQASFLSLDGGDLFCHYSAPDAASVRSALRELNTDMSKHWPGTIHDAPSVLRQDIATANVIVYRHFAEAVQLSDIQAVEDEHIRCLQSHRVRYLRTFFAIDRRHMACLYRAPDAEAVRVTQHQAGIPFEEVWAFQRLTHERA